MFIDIIRKICDKNKKVAMFIDMDGTIVEYRVYTGEKQLVEAHKNLLNEKPILPIIKVLEKINNIENIELYILSLSKNSSIKEQKKEWLKKHIGFIKEENWIILDKEVEEYNSENRNYIKYQQMSKRMNEFDYMILLDDDHKILKETKKNLQDKGEVFHISSVLI